LNKSNTYSGGAFGCAGYGHGKSSLGHKRKLPPHEQMKKISLIKAKQKLSHTEFQQRLKTVSCINYGEHGHVFEACTHQNLPDY
jgi:hypothetical protein